MHMPGRPCRRPETPDAQAGVVADCNSDPGVWRMVLNNFHHYSINSRFVKRIDIDSGIPGGSDAACIFPEFVYENKKEHATGWNVLEVHGASAVAGPFSLKDG